MPRFDGPYIITDINHNALMVTLNLPAMSKLCLTYHTTEIPPYNKNNCTLFPSQELTQLGLIVMEDGVQEYYVDKIIDGHKCG